MAKGRRPHPHRCSWNNASVDGLYKCHDGRWKIVATGERFTEPDERRAVQRFLSTQADSAGVLGLIGAITKFDPSRGVPFASFARPRIRGAILDWCRDADLMPRNTRMLSNKLEAARDGLTAELGRPPSDIELVEHLGMKPKRVAAIETLVWRYNSESLNRTIDFGEGPESIGDQHEQIRESDPFAIVADQDLRSHLLSLLSYQQAEVIARTFFAGEPHRQTASALGIGEGRSQQIVCEAKRRIAKRLSDRDVAELLVA